MAPSGDAGIRLLLEGLDEAFERRSWHGTNLRGAIRGLTPAAAAWRPAPGRHNIWEIVVHAAYWKYVVWRRLTGAARGSFPLEGSNWLLRPEPSRRNLARAWSDDVKLLVDQHRRLRKAVAGLRAANLHKRLGGSAGSPAFLVQGISAHDLYHAGQIQLLKRLRRR